MEINRKSYNRTMRQYTSTVNRNPYQVMWLAISNRFAKIKNKIKK